MHNASKGRQRWLVVGDEKRKYRVGKYNVIWFYSTSVSVVTSTWSTTTGKGKGKGTVRPRTGQVGPEGE
jgi:hypothetical protein